MSKQRSGKLAADDHSWRCIFQSALEEAWCPKLEEAIQKLPLEDMERELLLEQIQHFRKKLLLSVLKRNSAELRAYHEEHPDGLPTIFSLLVEQPNLFELVSQQYLNNANARQVDDEMSEGMMKVLPYVKLLLESLRSLPPEFHYKGQVYRALSDRHDHLERRFYAGRLFYRYGFNFTSKTPPATNESMGTLWRINTNGEAFNLSFLIQREADVLLPPLTCLEVLSCQAADAGADVIAFQQVGLPQTCPLEGCEKAISVEDMPEHLAMHFHTYWNYQKFSSHLTIQGFVPEKELRVLVSMLKTPANVQALELVNTDLSDTGTVILAEAMKVNRKVTHLALRSNLIAKRGALAMAEAVRCNDVLESLDMNSNEVGERGAEELAEALRQNTKLDTLDLANNQIGPKGLIPLAELLRRNRNRTLRHLALGNNNIGAEAIVTLAGVLRKNNTLVDLSLDLNAVGDKGAEALGEAISSNHALQRLDLSNNGIKGPGESESPCDYTMK